MHNSLNGPPHRRILLTPIGIQVVDIARRMLANALEIRALGASGGKEFNGVLRLGLPNTIGPYLLPRFVPDLQWTYPGLKLHVREQLPSAIPSELAIGRYDLAISPLPEDVPNLVSEPLFCEPFDLAVARSHPLAKKKIAQQQDLKGVDVLALEPGHKLHEAVLRLCAEFGATLHNDYEGTSLNTLRDVVSLGLGVTFLPELYVKSIAHHDARIVTMRIEDRGLYRTIGSIWRTASTRQDHFRNLATLFRKLAEQALRKHC